MKYLFDNCISHRFAKMLMAIDIDVIALRDGADYVESEIEPAKKSRGILERTVALCGALRLSAGAEDKGFEPSTGFPAPDFESGS